jgi:hypothetical protein
MAETARLAESSSGDLDRFARVASLQDEFDADTYRGLMMDRDQEVLFREERWPSWRAAMQERERVMQGRLDNIIREIVFGRYGNQRQLEVYYGREGLCIRERVYKGASVHICGYADPWSDIRRMHTFNADRRELWWRGCSIFVVAAPFDLDALLGDAAYRAEMLVFEESLMNRNQTCYASGLCYEIDTFFEDHRKWRSLGKPVRYPWTNRAQKQERMNTNC